MTGKNGQRGEPDNDRLLRALGQRQRQRDAADDSDAIAPDAEALFAPWDAADRDRLLAALQTKADEASKGGPRAAGDGGGAAVVPLPPRRSRRALLIATTGVLAAAAAVVLVSGRVGDQVLPPYVLVLVGGDQTVRGGDATAPTAGQAITLAADSSLEFQARPAQPAPVVAATAWFRPAGGGTLTPLQETPEISKEGAVRWRGTARALFGAASGPIVVRLVIGSGRLPASDEIAARPPGRYGSWQLLDAQVTVVGGGDQPPR